MECSRESRGEMSLALAEASPFSPRGSEGAGAAIGMETRRIHDWMKSKDLYLHVGRTRAGT